MERLGSMWTSGGRAMSVCAIWAVVALTPRVVAATTPLAMSDTIRGFVFDSLRHEPIGGATVIASPGGEQATATSEGRYTLISAQRITRVSVFHPLLDRTGIGSLSVEVGPATSHAQLILSTPSVATAWARLCGRPPTVAGRDGIVHGAARASDNSTRVAGVKVRVSWDVEETTLRNPTLPRVVEVRTDSTGSFAACGVPPLADVYVVAYSSQYNSGMLVLAADSVPLRKQELVLGSPGQLVTLRGRVRDARQQPIASSTVEIDGLPGSATTDDDGRFVLPAVPTGSRTLLARALGYTQVIQQVDVLQNGTEDVFVELRRTTRLPQVTVRGAAAPSPAAREYEEHKKMGFGAFLDSSQFANRATTRSIFQGAAGLTVSNNDSQSISTFKIYMPYTLGYCEANVIVDGYRSDTEMLATVPKAQIAAVEIYLRPNEVPGKYVPFDSICGTVVVWTKQAFAPPPAPSAPKARRPER